MRVHCGIFILLFWTSLFCTGYVMWQLMNFNISVLRTKLHRTITSYAFRGRINQECYVIGVARHLTKTTIMEVCTTVYRLLYRVSSGWILRPLRDTMTSHWIQFATLLATPLDTAVQHTHKLLFRTCAQSLYVRLSQIHWVCCFDNHWVTSWIPN